jgi:hypothetical protein
MGYYYIPLFQYNLASKLVDCTEYIGYTPPLDDCICLEAYNMNDSQLNGFMDRG